VIVEGPGGTGLVISVFVVLEETSEMLLEELMCINYGLFSSRWEEGCVRVV
jgi:hypothetical protein